MQLAAALRQSGTVSLLTEIDRYAPKSDPMPEAESDYSGPEMLLDHWSEAVSCRLESYTDGSEPLSTYSHYQTLSTC